MDYAARKGMDLETCERWLAPMLGYDRDCQIVNMPKRESGSTVNLSQRSFYCRRAY